MNDGERKRLQDALDWACAQGRVEGGWDVIHRLRPFQNPAHVVREKRPVDKLHLNGQGLEGLKVDAFKLAFAEENGNMQRTMWRLKMSRTAAYRLAKRAGVLSLFLICFSLFAAGPPMPLAVAFAPASPAVVSVPLTWDETPGATGYHVYWATNSGNATWLVLKTNNVTVTNLPAGIPVTFRLSAVNSDGIAGNQTWFTWYQKTDIIFEWLEADWVSGPWMIGGIATIKSNAIGTKFVKMAEPRKVMR